METVTEKERKIGKTKDTSMAKFDNSIDQLIAEQREFYRSGETRSYNFRKLQLKKLKKLIESNEEIIAKALFNDLGRSEFIASFTIGAVITEIKYNLEIVMQLRPPFFTRRLNKWMKPKRKRSPIMYLGSKVSVSQVPKGVVLIIGPWNYPFLLLMAPLVGAIAGGNCAVLKPSEFGPHTSKVMEKLINENFDRNYIHVVEGGVEEAKVLTSKPQWDHLFFTGGTEIGRKVYEAASKNLIPVTLELGGKSPTIIDKDVHLEITAKRLIQMKFINAGQTCMAPDYVFVHKEVKEELYPLLKKYLNQMFGENKQESLNYGQIIDERQFKRLIPYVEDGEKITGGEYDLDARFIEPTLLDNVSVDDPIMQEEIFGPILPMIPWDDEDEIIAYIENNPHPLALYVYTKNKKFKEKVINNTHFGASMINDSVLYILHPGIPFGGIGDSGIGNYTGKYSFDTFTQTRPVVEFGGIVDRTAEKLCLKFFRYPPQSKLKMRLLKLAQRKLSRFRF